MLQQVGEEIGEQSPGFLSDSGLYMLMTVLKGDLATKQSIAIIRTFRSVKDYKNVRTETITI